MTVPSLLTARGSVPGIPLPKGRLTKLPRANRYSWQFACSRANKTSTLRPPTGWVEASERLRPYSAAIIALLPALTPLSAVASVDASTLQAASPWLAIIIGALAFAAAAPKQLRYTPENIKIITKHDSVPDTSEVFSAIKSEQTASARADEQNSSAPVSLAIAVEMEEEIEEADSTDAETGVVFASQNAGETDSQKVPVELLAATSKPEYDGVIEWSGLDAGEQVARLEPSALVNGAHIDLLPEGAETENVELPAALLAARPQPSEGSAETVAAASAVNEAAELQKEYQAKLAALKAAQNDITSAKSTAAKNAIEDKAAALKSTYDAKLAALKATAAKREQEAARQQNARFNVMKNIQTSAQSSREQRKSAEAEGGLSRIAAPALGLAAKTPKAMLQSLVETIVAFWKWLKFSAKKMAGERPTPQPQS